MACPEPQMTQEGIAFQVMTGTVSFEAKGNALTIYAANGANSIEFASVTTK